jgi:hypothetical protein
MKFNKVTLASWIIMMFATLLAAYWASLPKSDQQGTYSTQNISLDLMSFVVLSTGGITITAEKIENDRSRWWIKTEIESKDDEGQGVMQKGQLKFIASEKFEDYLMQLGRFPVLREIGQLSEVELKNFGFTDTQDYLRVKNAKGELILSFRLGSQTYGARSRYVMRGSDKKVFMINSNLIDDLKKPEVRFFEREITRVSLVDVRKIQISANGLQKVFKRISQSDSNTLQWFDESTQSQPVAAVGVWLEKFFEFKAAEYADDLLREDLMELQPVLVLQVIDERQRSEKFEILTISRNGKKEFYLSSGYLSWPVKIATARSENLIKDLPPILQN